MAYAQAGSGWFTKSVLARPLREPSHSGLAQCQRKAARNRGISVICIMPGKTVNVMLFDELGIRLLPTAYTSQGT